MDKITARDVLVMLYKDYEHNYRPRKEITVILSFDQIKSMLDNVEFQKQIRLTWHFKFYMKQVLLASWAKIDSTLSSENKIAMIKELDDIVRFHGDNETRAFVALIKVYFFLEILSNYRLQEIFDGHSVYDDHCAQIAYSEYLKRFGDRSEETLKKEEERDSERCL